MLAQIFRILLITLLALGLTVEVFADSLAPAWQYLSERLAHDGVKGPKIDALLLSLPHKPTQDPMGRKILALYKRNFFPKKRIKLTDYYKGVVTKANAHKCKLYIGQNKEAFLRARKVYGVPEEIACALLFVETRLGEALADVPENAFYTLASMAQARTPQDISSWLPKMKGSEKPARMKWIANTMPGRAEWAYKEFRALIVYMAKYDIAPSEVPGSIYGAVGLCQFMPSNIDLYGADGNNDGKIDLFNIDDAIMSIGRYLAKHGWKEGVDFSKQHALLMKYNHSKVYANTILALSALIAE